MDAEERRKRQEEKKLQQQRLREEKKEKAEAKKAMAEGWKQKGAQQDNKTIRLKKEYVSKTKPGEKKDTSAPLSESYNPPEVEDAWYDWWVQSGFFSPDYKRPGETEEEHLKREPFVIVIPPPNVTGSLHIGHALTNSIEDCICRFQRMNGKRVLWVPGTDHAGIATQSVVERKIWEEEQKTRHDYGREAFIAKVWEWKERYGNRICQQLRRLGSSLDWSHEHFTMDSTLSEAVQEAFLQFHSAGLVYRSKRLVNWSCTLQTAISDIECDDWDLKEKPQKRGVPGHPEKAAYDFGYLWSFAYKIEDSDEEIIVSTTRPETMLGDTAIAVHPDDEKYKHLHGKFATHPFVKRRLPIICDAKLVKIGFGTGAVKITPAHDHNDYECGQRHNLEIITILNLDGTMNSEAGEFAGLPRFEARIKVLKRLTELNLFKGREANPMTIKTCSRSADIIEPMLTPQWWVNMDDLAAKSMKAVEDGELTILPPSRVSAWNEFLGNPRPWCISRQLWWGHRIPAYLAWKKGTQKPAGDNNEDWIISRSLEEARKTASTKLGLPEEDIEIEQDEDVLDTWFSSGLFPFSVFGWPNKTPDLDRFYPTALLETGHDILFFWVARMVMMGLQLTGRLPFKEVLLHSLVRDKNGKKMSKSSGNVIDPIDVIEGITLEGLHDTLRQGNLRKDKLDEAIKTQKKDFPKGISECGTDALRFTLCAYMSQGRDINLDVLRVEGYRAFCNKLWQATKLGLRFLGDNFTPATNPAQGLPGTPTLFDRWILHRLNKTTTEVTQGLQEYDFARATTALYGFWLYNFCDVYLEVLKGDLFAEGDAKDENKIAAHREAIYICLDEGFKLLHPFMPFLTEELWQHLPRRSNDLTPSISVAAFPQPYPERDNQESEGEVEEILNVAKVIRSSCATYGMIKKKTVTVVASVSDERLKRILTSSIQDIVLLSFLKAFEVHDTLTEAPKGTATEFIDPRVTLYVHLEGIDIAKELQKLEKTKEKLIKDTESLLKTRETTIYIERVPEAVKEQDAQKLRGWEADISAVTRAITTLSDLS